MRTRLTGLCTALALLAAAALPLAAPAQDPSVTPTPTPTATPSPTATPTPTPEPTDPEAEEEERQDAKDRKRKVIRRIYRDFERDGRVAACDHSRKALRIAKRSIDETYEEDFPDFRDAVQAAIDRHRKGRCEPLPEDRADDDPTPTPTPGSLGGGTAPPPPPLPPPPPDPAPESGDLPDLGGGGGGGGDVTPLPPGEGAIPEGTPAPSPESTPPAPQGPPQLVVTPSTAKANLLLPWTMLAIALAGLLFAALTAVAGKRSERFEGVGHAWREAAWRTSGTWGDFTDWLRSGR